MSNICVDCGRIKPLGSESKCRHCFVKAKNDSFTIRKQNERFNLCLGCSVIIKTTVKRNRTICKGCKDDRESRGKVVEVERCLICDKEYELKRYDQSLCGNNDCAKKRAAIVRKKKSQAQKQDKEVDTCLICDTKFEMRNEAHILCGAPECTRKRANILKKKRRLK